MEKKTKFKPTAELQKLGLVFGGVMLFYQLIYGVFSTYVSPWMTDYLHITAAHAGMVITVGGIFDTIGVVVVGFIVQNTNLKHGKYRSWLRFMPIIFTIAYVLVFVTWPTSEIVTTVIMTLLYVIGGIAVNFVLLCQRGLESKCGKTQEGRVFLVGRDGLFMTIGRAIYGAIFLWFVATVGQGNDNRGYLIYFLIFGVLNIIMWIILNKVCAPYETDTDEETAKAELETTKLGLKSTFEALIKNPQFLAFFISETVMDIGIMVSYTTMYYYFAYVIGDLKWMTIYLTSSTITGIIGTWLGPYICRIIDKKWVFSISLLGYFLGFFVSYMQYRISGYSSGLFFCVVINIAIIIFNFQNAFKYTLFMDCAEYGFHRNGKETMSFLLSLSNFPFKIAMALAGVIIGAALTAAGYVGGMEPTPDLIDSLSNICLLLPSICLILSTVVFTACYRLTGKKMSVIVTDNAKKKVELGLMSEEDAALIINGEGAAVSNADEAGGE